HLIGDIKLLRNQLDHAKIVPNIRTMSSKFTCRRVHQARPTGNRARLPHPLHSLPSSVPRFRTVDLPERYNVGADLLERNLQAGRAAKVAIHSASGDLTYGDLARLVAGAARALLDLGLRREERVLIVGYDSPSWVAAFLGAIRIGSIPVPVNPLLQRSEDYDHYIDDSLAQVVVVDANTE